MGGYPEGSNKPIKQSEGVPVPTIKELLIPLYGTLSYTIRAYKPIMTGNKKEILNNVLMYNINCAGIVAIHGIETIGCSVLIKGLESLFH